MLALIDEQEVIERICGASGFGRSVRVCSGTTLRALLRLPLPQTTTLNRSWHTGASERGSDDGLILPSLAPHLLEKSCLYKLLVGFRSLRPMGGCPIDAMVLLRTPGRRPRSPPGSIRNTH